MADIEIHLKKRTRSYYFNIYESKEPNSFLSHFLYHNQFDGEYLLPEFKHMDFLWLMKGDCVEDEKCNWIKQAVKSIAGVQLVAELTNEQIKTKGNMVFWGRLEKLKELKKLIGLKRWTYKVKKVTKF